MNEMDRSKQPWVLGLLSALVIGLASFIVWLLRLISKPVEENPPMSSSANRLPPSIDANPMATYPSYADEESAYTNTIEEAPIQPEVMTQIQPAPIMATDNNIPWTAPTRYLAGTGIFLFFLWLISYSRQSLTMLIFAALIAILVRPAIQFLHVRLRFPQGLAVIVMYLVAALLVFALPILIIPNVIQGINSLLNYDWQGVLEGITWSLQNASDRVATFPLIGSGLATPLTALSEAAQNLFNVKPPTSVPATSMTESLSNLGEKIGFLGGLIGPLASGILAIVFMLLISLQMSLAREQIKGWVTKLFPERFTGEMGALLDRILFVWVSFLRGQFSLMVVMGLITWILNLFLGTPQALLLGILAGLLEIIPSLGPLLATIPAAILAVLFGSTMFPGLNPWVFMLIVIIGYTLVQFLENQVLVPKILGNAVSLPPLIVLIGVTVAGTQAGIVGVFLATPMIATGKEVLEYLNRKINQEPEISLPDEKKPSLTEQMRGFVGRIRLPFRHTRQPNVEASESTDAMA